MIDKQSIKRQLESMRCREHGGHPTVSVTSQGVQINCCCERFRAELSAKAKQLIGQQAQKQIEESVQKAFKGFKLKL